MANKQKNKGDQGFASMDEDKQRDIASKGGKASRKGKETQAKREDDSADDDDNEHEGKGKQGFASMDKEKVREIASKGGKSSHRGGSSDDEEDEEDDDDETEAKGKQGFASMDKEKVREIASKGGKSSQRGASSDDEEADDLSLKINSLVEIFQEDLTSLDADTATAAIDEWYGLLKGSKDKNLKQIATSLKDLKGLVAKEADESKIAEILISLGEQVEGLAANADESIAESLQELGVALTDAGDSLE